MRLHLILLLFALAFLPSQLALHFWPQYALVFGVRVDYLAPKVYFSEIILILALGLWVVKDRPKIKYPWIAILILIFIAINIAVSVVPPVSLHHWVKIAECVLLAWMVYLNRIYVQKYLPLVFTISASLVLLLSLSQLLLQRSIGGMLYWLGEREFNSNTPGIAKLRPYATFPHPNVLGSFGLLVALIAKKWGRVSGLMLAIISFSQAVWMAAVGTFLNRHVKKILLLVVALSFILPFVNLSINSYDYTSRWALQQKAVRLIAEHPWGVGLGNFVATFAGHEYLQQLGALDARLRFQPVHNVFLLIASELGIIGLAAVCFGLWQYLGLANKLGKQVVVILLITGLVDHYWLTLWQPMMLLSIFLALGIASKSGTMDK